MSSTQAGDLRELVKIYQSTSSVNDMGETVDSMEYVRSIWAQVMPSTGRREDYGLLDRIRISHRVVCRDSVAADLKTNTYFMVRGQKLKLEYWYPIYQRRGFVEIYCSEVIE